MPPGPVTQNFENAQNYHAWHISHRRSVLLAKLEMKKDQFYGGTQIWKRYEVCLSTR